MIWMNRCASSLTRSHGGTCHWRGGPRGFLYDRVVVTMSAAAAASKQSTGDLESADAESSETRRHSIKHPSASGRADRAPTLTGQVHIECFLTNDSLTAIAAATSFAAPTFRFSPARPVGWAEIHGKFCLSRRGRRARRRHANA